MIVANNSFTPETGIEIIRSGDADMVSFGRLYISNPDLAERILNDWPLNKDLDMKTLYGHTLGALGYTDYAFHKTTSA